MKLEKYQVERILKTLPIGYYLKRNIDVVLNETSSSSFIDLFNQKIEISLRQLNKVAKTYAKNTSYYEIENDVRCMLYHEVSHALLTPKTLHINDINNIFEDERIETICQSFYKDVNFKQFVMRLNNFDFSAPASPMQMFYQVVRYRFGPKQFTSRVQKIITSYSYITHFTTSSMYMYETDIEILYQDIKNYFVEQLSKESNTDTCKSNKENTEDVDDIKESNKKSMNSNEEESNEEESNKESIDTDDYNASETSNIEANSDIDSYIESLDTAVELAANELSNKLNKALDKYKDNNVHTALVHIFDNYKSHTKSNGSAISSYSGVFNPRACSREDCRYFLQQNRQGNYKRFSKLHLNLFIDVSGSFCRSEHTVNVLLFELARIEKENSNFSFDLVTCQIGQEIKKKNERYIDCDGGNDLDDKIFTQFVSLQHKDKEVVNIVLFDGDAFTDSWGKYNPQRNFSAFNKSNVIIISDESNKDAITTYAPTAKTIITKKYAEELYDAVTASLSQLLR